jgi:hypothetical protein
MTRAQFAIAAGATEKWLHNAAAALGRRIRYTPEEARRLFVARAIQASLATTLRVADQIAARALAASGTGAPVEVSAGADHTVAVRVDVPTLLSAATARLALALNDAPRRRGRPASRRRGGNARERARRYGVDLSLIDAHLARTPGQRVRDLNENLPFVLALRRAARR